MNRSLLNVHLVLAFAALTACSFAQVAVDPKIEAKALETRASEVTKKIGELASSGKLPTSEEGIALLKQLVDELSEIRERLSALEGDVKTVKGQQQPSKTSISGYAQFQYRDTNQPGGQFDAFQIRRARLNVNHNADSRTLIRVSADFASGGNQLGAQLKDAFALYSFPGWPSEGGVQVQGGQFTLPVSYQLILGDLEREFPERTAYMQALFNGERSRGVVSRVSLGHGLSAFAGGMNALTISDPEQANLAAGPGSKLAGMGGLTYSNRGLQAQVAAYVGERAATTNGGVAVPETERSWVIVGGSYSDRAKTPLSARAEFMSGKDRVPGTSNPALMNGTNMRAWNLQLGYYLSNIDGIYLRYEDWNRNTSTPGFSLRGLAVAYQRDLTQSIRFVGAYERYDDQMMANPYGITTLRLQYRF